MPNIKFGSLTPDLGPLNNPGLLKAENVIPLEDGYAPFRDQVALSSALTARCQGAISAKDYDGNSYNYAGDATKLYELAADTTWTDVTNAGGPYTTSAEEQWHFTVWGEQILATNFADVVQTFTMGTSSKFTNLAGTPPQARYIAVIRNDFVVLANTFDGVDGNRPNRVWNSGIGDETAWTVSSTTQANSVDLDPNLGPIKNIIGGEYGSIFCENGIVRMTYVGSPLIFQYDVVESQIGLFASRSAISIGNRIFFLSERGFYIFDGQNTISIGQDEIDEFVLADLDRGNLDKISTAFDSDQSIVYMAYPGSGSRGGVPNRLLAYNFSPTAKRRWTRINIESELIFTTTSLGYTLDTLDTVSTSIDALPFSLDSSAWQGGIQSIGSFDFTHKLSGFTGDPLTATLETGEFQLNENQLTTILRVRPLVQGNCLPTIRIGYRNHFCDDVVYTSSLGTTSDFSIPIRNTARYQRLEMTITGDYNFIYGFNLEETVAGGFR